MLQLPRGNLEAFEPRPLVLLQARTLIDRGDFLAALLVTQHFTFTHSSSSHLHPLILISFHPLIFISFNPTLISPSLSSTPLHRCYDVNESISTISSITNPLPFYTAYLPLFTPPSRHILPLNCCVCWCRRCCRGIVQGQGENIPIPQVG